MCDSTKFSQTGFAKYKASRDRIRAYKKQMFKIIKILKNEKRYSLLQKYYSELRRWEELEMRVDNVVKPDKGGATLNVFTGDIRGEPEKKAEVINVSRLKPE